MSDLQAEPADGMYAFYRDYYAAIAVSRVYGEFCSRVFGADYGQHGFADMGAVDRLIAVGGLDAYARILELGCGSGGIAAYIAEQCGGTVTGIDYAPAAIGQAQVWAARGAGRLRYEVADIVAPPFADGSFTAVVAIDTLYFTDLDTTLAEIRRVLAPGGQLLAYYAQGANPAVPVACFDRSTLPAAATDLGRALRRQRFVFETWDVTAADMEHARRKRAVLEELAADFAAEGMRWLYENRMGEALGVIAAGEAGCHARYLYWATPD